MLVIDSTLRGVFFYTPLAQLVDATLSKGVCSPFESGEGYHCSYNLMVECLFGMEAMKVRFFLRAPLTHTFKYSIIDHLAIVQWIVHRASTSRMWVRFLLAGPYNFGPWWNGYHSGLRNQRWEFDPLRTGQSILKYVLTLCSIDHIIATYWAIGNVL